MQVESFITVFQWVVSLDLPTYIYFYSYFIPHPWVILGTLRYGDYGIRTTVGRALSFVCSTELSRANIKR